MLPLLSMESHAQVDAPKRLLILGKNNGAHLPAFFPSEPAAGNVASLMDGPLPATLSPLEDIKQHLVVLGGLEHTAFAEIPNYNGHGSWGALLTGKVGSLLGEGTYGASGGGISIDQFVAQRIAEQVSLPFTTLNLGMSPGGSFSWMDRDSNVSDEWNPEAAFDRLFGGLTLSPDQADRIRAERRSILDYVGRELEAYSELLGSEDRARVERHMTSVRELEKRVQGIDISNACMPKLSLPEGFATYLAETKHHFVAAMRDIAVQALICDATRVVTFGAGDSNFPLTFVGANFQKTCDDCDAKGGAATFHDITHFQYQDDYTALKVRGDQWWLDTLLGAAVRQLASISEGDGTMLDHTVVLLTDDMANGAVHDQTGVPWLIAGGRALGIQGGRFVHQGQIAPHNGVLVAVAHAMGYPVDFFGDPKFGGLLPGILS
jgi:hypothetical protein